MDKTSIVVHRRVRLCYQKSLRGNLKCPTIVQKQTSNNLSEKIAPDRIETVVAYIKKIDEQYVTLSTEPTLREHLEAIRLLLSYIGRTVRRGCCGPNCRRRCCRASRSTTHAAKSQCPCGVSSLTG
jgi:hypothetical protein